MKYLFGPVNSRRLGLSLGVDLLPYKTCTLDCIYCECGHTTSLRLERGEFVPTAEVLAELDDYQGRLKSLTGGQGSYTIAFSHYAPVPANVQHTLSAQYKAVGLDDE